MSTTESENIATVRAAVEAESEQVVAGQLDAYNARDIDAFMAAWAEDALYFEHPDKLLASGAGAIRARHVERFREPDLHGKLIHRMVVGNKVVDHELVTRNFPEGRGSIGVIAIYEVLEQKIARAWFMLGAKTIENQS